MSPPRTVVFVCLHGSAKSVVAAAHLQRLADRQGLGMRAIAAGVEPDPEIPATVRDGLLGDGIDVRGRRPSRVNRDVLAGAWRIVVFGCDVTAIAPAGVPVERWDEVPAVSEDFHRARDAIVGRLTRLLAEARGPARSARG